jgi:signal transduction histidine kinase
MATEATGATGQSRVTNNTTIGRSRERTGERVSARLAERVGLIVTTLTVLVAIVIVLLSAALSLAWYNQPFVGVLTNHLLVVNATIPLSGDATEWPGFKAGLKTSDRLLTLSYADQAGAGRMVEVDFRGVAAPGDALNKLLASGAVAGEVAVQVWRPSTTFAPEAACTPAAAPAGGAICTFRYALGQFPLSDFLGQFGIAFAVQITLLLIALWLWLTRRQEMFVQLTCLLCAAGAIALVGRFESISTYQLTLFWLFGVCAVGGVFIQIGIEFPYNLVSVRRRPWLRILLFLSPLLLFTVSLLLYSMNMSQTFFDAPQLVGVLSVVVGGFLMILMMLIRYRRSVSPILREKSAIVTLGMALALAPVIVWLVTVLLERITGLPNLAFSSAYILPLTLVIPISLIYAQGTMPLSSDQIIGTGAVYSVLGALLVGGFVMLSGAAYILTAGVMRPTSPVLIALTLFAIAVLFTPLRLRVEQAVDAAFFRQRQAYDKRLEAFVRALTSSVDVNDVSQTLLRELQESIAPQYVHIFLRTYPSNDFEALADPATGRSTTNVRFRADSDLAQLFEAQTSILRLDVAETPPIRVSAERARLAILNTPVIVRMRSARRLNGFIALGARQGRNEYGAEESRYLENLAAQAAAAYERAQIILEAQRNERELKVLSQVSAALNIVMDFDTLLEFVYTQVDKIIPTKNFYIAFRDAQTDELYYAFYQEDGDRIDEYEGFRWRIGRDLYSEVVRSQQPFKTDNFVQESQRRDPRIRIDNNAIRAWMGVPLNASEGLNLGCLALASTDPTISYSNDQMRIVWDIASLAATALYKTRLFAETEERGRQMKMLNDISSRLAMVFENIDELFPIITESAVAIMDCQAGNLLLRDENGEDLIFISGVGSGDEMFGRRIPINSGIAGSVVTSGRPALVNDIQRDPRLFSEMNARRGSRKMITNTILAVPLVSRGAVIGVLEVINKKDGNNFDERDMELLTTFASQAAVAIENARLYRSTDEQLAIRVQQLDSMQRIDQELNRTLDLNRVIAVTVENALRESGADAGALVMALPETGRFLVVGSLNYPPDMMQPESTLPMADGTLGIVYKTGHPWLLTGEQMQADLALLPGARSQLAVPLITGSATSAVLILESLEPHGFTPAIMSQMQALAEHANTAIVNAQLYTQLDDANQARTKFVGFVAHELKNPMASIKGYAEVLIGGLAGSLNEQQQNFITVIRRNVVRMQQLVEDLRDLVAQESGALRLNPAPVNFNTIILEAVRPQQRLIDERSQKVVLNVPENLPLVWGDELRLIQILTNLVSNANKYTPNEGTITITANALPNAWDPQGPPDVIYCSISDTGIGMDEQDLAKLFTPYWRSDNPRVLEQPGTGLGMTLTRGLIESHRGKLWVESKLNVGTTFHFTVPLVSAVEIVKPVPTP